MLSPLRGIKVLSFRRLSHQESAISFNSRTNPKYDSLSRLLAFQSGIGLVADIAGGGTLALLKEARENWLEERAEDNLSAVGHGQGHPQDQDELEDVVEGEPVNGINDALKDSEESINDPVRQPLCIISLVTTEQSLKGIVSGYDEAGEVDEELATDVKEDEEEVETDEAEEGVDFWHTGLFLEVVEHRILAKFLIDLRDLVLGFILKRHREGGQVSVHKGISTVVGILEQVKCG